MHKIVFLDRETLARQIRLRRPRFTRDLIEHHRTAPQELPGRLAGASIEITRVDLRRPRLSMVQR
jgi:glycerate dehydrogenase